MLPVRISVYALFNPINKSVFYIGATSKCIKARLQEHIHTHNRFTEYDKYKSRQIREILSVGKEVQVFELEECGLDDVKFLEEFYMSLFEFYGFKIDQQRFSTYGPPPANVPPVYKKNIAKSAIIYTLIWIENGLTRRIKFSDNTKIIPEATIKESLYDEYNIKKASKNRGY